MSSGPGERWTPARRPGRPGARLRLPIIIGILALTGAVVLSFSGLWSGFHDRFEDRGGVRGTMADLNRPVLMVLLHGIVAAVVGWEFLRHRRLLRRR